MKLRYRKLLATLLMVAMLTGFFPAITQPVQATEGEYVYYTADTNGQLTQYTGTISEGATSVTNNDTMWTVTAENGGWYIVSGTVELSDRVTVNGDVHLVLTDGCSLTIDAGIHLSTGNSLTIYGQSAGTGQLIAGSYNCPDAAIGGNAGIDADGDSSDAFPENGENAGTLIVHGGQISATSSNSAAIGGGAGGNDRRSLDENAIRRGGDGGVGGTVIVYSGTITANSNSGAAIGGGVGGFDEAGIAEGCSGGKGGAGGILTVYGGEINANSSLDGAAIGGGGGGHGSTVSLGRYPSSDGGGGGNGGVVTIYGGEVTADGGSGAGIGGGAGATGNGGESGCGGNGGIVIISGGTVIASASDGAGIGGGSGSYGFGNTGVNGGDGGTITITAGTVTTYAGRGAAIGGGSGGDGGGMAGAAFVGGTGGTGGTIMITGGTITASRVSGYSSEVPRGADIGGGSGGDGLSLGDGSTPGQGGTGGSGGTILLLGGTINAERIGGGDGGYGGVSGSIESYVQAQHGAQGNGIESLQDGGYQVFGDLILAENYTFPNDETLTIPEGTSLTIPENVTLTVGTLINNGTLYLYGQLNGMLTGNGKIPVVSLSLTPSTLQLYTGQTASLNVTALPTNHTQTLSWSSSDERVATVDSAGRVAAVSTGTATITATAGDVSASCDVTVTAPTESETPSTPSSPSQPTTPSEPEEPSGPSTGDSEGWDGIRDEIAGAEDGASIVVDMNGETEVPAEIFEEVAGKDVTIEFDLGDGVKWEVKGTDIPADANLSDLDLGVSMNTSGIPVDVINAITGEATSVQITLAHDGDFGFTLTLIAPLGEENAGYWANLYHFDEDAEQLNFETAAEIDDDGTARLRLTHASQYTIVIDDHSHAPVTTLPFNDVNADDWFYDPVVWAYDEGLMTGTSATTFEPNTSTTRAMIVAILNRLESGPTADGGTFTDVHTGDWYAEAVNWAASAGIVAGFTDNTFQPNAPITREQMAAILYNYAQWKGMDVSARADLSRYSDQPSAWANEVMQWAVGKGLISGTSATTLDPQGHATRAQVAAILQRFLES